MTNIRLGSISLDCADPATLGAFWANLLDGDIAFESDGFVAVKLANTWISAVKVEKYTAPTWPEDDVAKQLHLDLAVDDLAAGVAQAVALGAVKPEAQSAPERFIVLLDPAGHPFCLTTMIPD